jgi:hypothetical protein
MTTSWSIRPASPSRRDRLSRRIAIASDARAARQAGCVSLQAPFGAIAYSSSSRTSFQRPWSM